MEDHLERISMTHSESQQSIQSISQSLSSLASHMSQLFDGTQLMELNATTSPSITDSKNRQSEWCCDALSGIDDAFKEDDLGQRCIFCTQRFTEDEGTRRKSELSYVRGKHLTDVHLFGTCNLSVTYKTLEEFEVHLDEYHHTSTDEINRDMIGRFRRQKGPLRLFRRDAPSQGQPSIIDEQSTLRLILDARLRASLDEGGMSWMHINTALEQIYTHRHPTDVLGSLSDYEGLRKLYYDIACIEEELIVSGNESHDNFLEHALEVVMPKLGEEMEGNRRRESRWNGPYAQRNRINDWFLQILNDSRTLIALLRLGRVTPELAELPYASNASKVASIRRVIEFWGLDEAATGFEHLYETSDGAVDSRDDLEVNIGLEANPRLAQGAGESSAAGDGSLGVSKFSTAWEAMLGDGKPVFSNDLPVNQSNGMPRMTDDTPQNIGWTSPLNHDSRDQYYSYVTKSRSGSVHSGASTMSLGSSAGYDDQHRALPRPPGLFRDDLPPAPQSLMGQFSSKVSSPSQKKHKCQLCDKRFTRPSSLQTHMSVSYTHLTLPTICSV